MDCKSPMMSCGLHGSSSRASFLRALLPTDLTRHRPLLILIFCSHQNMQENLYCEPCHQLLCGDVNVIGQSGYHITFIHHHDFESFEKALQLPCTICTMAWTYVRNPPFAAHWVRMVGEYVYEREVDEERTLWFSLYGQNDHPNTSTVLWLEPCASE